MILPVSITTKWISSFTVSKTQFDKVESYFENEDYLQAKLAIEELSFANTKPFPEESVPGLQVLVMYGWTLFREKKHAEFEGFFDHFSDLDLALYPDLEVLRLWYLQFWGRDLELYEACISNLEIHGKKVDISCGYFLFLKGRGASGLGKVQEAISHAESSFSIFSLCGHHQGAGYASNFLGMLNRMTSDFRESLKWYKRSLAQFEGRNWFRRESMVHLNIGVTQYKLGNFSNSKISLEKALGIGVEKKLSHSQLFPNIALGNVNRIQRDLATAKKHLHTAYTQAQSLHYPREEALSLEFLGDIFRDEGQPAEARRYYQRAMAIGKSIAPKGDIVMEVHRRIGECHNLEGNYEAAKPELEQSLKLAQAQGDRYEEGVILRILAETYRNTFDNTKAVEYSQDSINILRSIEAKYELAVSLLSGAEITFAQLEDPSAVIPKKLTAQKAWDQCTKALDLFIQIKIPFWIGKTRVLVDKIVNTRAAIDRAERTGIQTNKNKTHTSYTPGDAIIHSSSLMKDLLELCDMYAISDEPILILGETGTGKELIAKRIHRTSTASMGELVTVNVAAIPDQMFEREFFGHVRGSFSGADRDGQGYAALAHNGTLFLDEIGDLPMDAQAKLLRLLQDGTYQALGDPAQRHANIRFVAATNADIPQLVADGKFRSDLYYRLSTLEISVPPLRNRPEDVLPLLRHFLSVAAKSPRDLTEYFNRSSLDLLEQHNWPGNVREISIMARRAHVELISRGRVHVEIKRRGQESLMMSGPGFMAMEENAANNQQQAKESIAEVAERGRIITALEKVEGRKILAAQALGISRSTLYRKMEKFGIEG